MRTAYAFLWLVASVLTVSSTIFAGTYSGGSGTEADPYQISTVADWQELMTTSADWDKSFILKADLDLAGVTLTPIAPDTDNAQADYQGTPFSGTFDGRDHIIRNAVFNLPAKDYVGLFGQIGSGGKINKLGMEDARIKGRDYVGGLVGTNSGTVNSCYVTGEVRGNLYIGGLMGGNGGQIDSCYSMGVVNGTSNDVGGLVGINWYGTISNCYATGIVTAPDGSWNVGGLVGLNYSTITSCYATGGVHGRGWVGGLVGMNTYGAIDSCYATGAVASIGHYVGGLVGSNGGGGTITSCWAMGDVTGLMGGNGGGYVGGLVGENYALIDLCYATGVVTGSGIVGGLVGNNINGSTDSSYATGEVNGLGPDVGGLVGANSGTIDSCYATGEVNGTSNDVGGLVGINSGTIDSSYSTGAVSGEGNDVGGIVGKNSNGAIDSSYATGDVSGTGKDVGGLVGNNIGSIDFCYATGKVDGTVNDVGGLVGINSGTIDSSYSTGAVSGGGMIGGMVGKNDGWFDSVLNCFWDVDTSGQMTSDGGTGKTTAEMKTKSTFTDAGWDFTMVPIWKMTSQINDSYPSLAWQEPDLVITELTITSPNGGEIYTIGTTRPISWDWEGEIARVVLEYSIDNGQNWNAIDTVDNTKSFEWLVPSTPSKQCLIRISKEGDASVSDVSNAVFEITHVLVLFADANLKAAVEAALGVMNPTAEDMLKLTGLSAKNKGITSLVGLETALNLGGLSLDTNQVSDITPLAGLTKLATLALYSNKVTDVSPLAGLTKLYSLVLSANKVSDITPLAGMVNLVYLYINNNPISDFSALTGNTKFKEIYATRTAVLTKETYLAHIPAIRANNPMLAVFQYDQGCQTLRKADANEDCKVNLLDLAVIASEWLTCNHIYEEMCP